MADIFISYSKAKREVTEHLARDLEAAGYSVWWDTSLAAGERFQQVILQRIAEAKAAIVIWTPESVKSIWVQSEAERAWTQGKLITVRTADILDLELPPPFDRLHTPSIDDRESIFAALVKLGVHPTHIHGEIDSQVEHVDLPAVPEARRCEQGPRKIRVLAGVWGIFAFCMFAALIGIASYSHPVVFRSIGHGWNAALDALLRRPRVSDPIAQVAHLYRKMGDDVVSKLQAVSVDLSKHARMIEVEQQIISVWAGSAERFTNFAIAAKKKLLKCEMIEQRAKDLRNQGASGELLKVLSAANGKCLIFNSGYELHSGILRRAFDASEEKVRSLLQSAELLSPSSPERKHVQELLATEVLSLIVKLDKAEVTLRGD